MTAPAPPPRPEAALGGVLPARLAPLLAPGLAPATAERLMASARLGPRLPAWLDRVLGPVDLVGLTRAEAALAGADGAALRRAAGLAGAVWHARRVKRLLRASDVAGLVAAQGEAARQAAFAHADLAVDAAEDRPLPEAIAADGAACLAAWREALPGPVAEWILLRLPDGLDARPEPAHRGRGPDILRRVAAEAVAP